MNDLFSRVDKLPVRELQGFDLVLEQTLSQPQYQYWKQIVNTAGRTTVALLREVLLNAEHDFVLEMIAQCLIGAGIDTLESNPDELVRMQVSSRLTKIDYFPAFIAANGQTETLDRDLVPIIENMTERELMFSKFFARELERKRIIFENKNSLFSRLLELSTVDYIPNWVHPENIHLFLKIYPARRSKMSWEAHSEIVDVQAELLRTAAAEGSRGLTKENADISRDMIGHLGKLLQSLIYFQLWNGNIKNIPNELKIFLEANTHVDKESNMWDEFEGGKATEYFKSLFDDGKECSEAYYYTADLIAWWLLTGPMRSTLKNFDLRLDINDTDASELQKWLKQFAEIDISSIVSGFSAENLHDLEDELEYLLSGFKFGVHIFPGDEEILVDKVPTKVVTQAVLETVSGWLRSNYKNIMYSTTYSLMGITRVINADFINQLRKGTYFTEFAVPSDRDTSQRCDIVILPEELDIEEPTWSDFANADILEIKLVQSLSINPSKKFMTQIEKYIKNIRKVNPKIKLKAYLLEVSGMGIKLTDVSNFLEL